MPYTVKLALAVLFVAITFFLAALQIPHIGEGAPDWHTVRNPQIPIKSIDTDASPPEQAPEAPPAGSDAGGLSGVASKEHPPISFVLNYQVWVAEPVYGWKWDEKSKTWKRVRIGEQAVLRSIEKRFTAYWVVTRRCYCIIDDYGRLRSIPEFR